MSILVVSGHEAASCSLAFSALKRAGVLEARAFRNGDFSADTLLQQMCHAYKLNGTRRSGYSQISPGKIWEALSVDLVLANSEGDSWGWAAPDSIHFLDYWRDFDDRCNYVLVYSSPEQAVARLLEDGASDPETIKTELSKWRAYNEELLRFHAANPGRSILVNAEAVAEAPVDLISICQERFGLDLCRVDEPLESDGGVSAMALWSASMALSSFSDATVLFEELQSIADLQRSGTATPDQLGQDAWLTVKALEKDNDVLRQEVARLVADLGEASLNAAEKAKMKDDNELLLLQLHQVQEELEYYFLEYRDLQSAQEEVVDGTLVASAVPHVGSDGAVALAAGSTVIDMRYLIRGENWYGAETDGRWAGPETRSTLRLPMLESGRYRLEVDIVDAMSREIVRDMRISINGDAIEPIRRWFGQNSGVIATMRWAYLTYYKRRQLYPVRVSGVILIENSAGDLPPQIEFDFPDSISPVSRGGQDTRSVSIRLRQVVITRL